MPKPYTLLAGGSSPQVHVEAPTLLELFEIAGYAAFDLGYVLDDVAPTYSRPIVAPGDTATRLLANWVDELIAWSATEGLVWSYFVVDRLEEGGVQGSASGMPAGEVVARERIVSGVAHRNSRPDVTIVEVPEGWWADLTFETRPRLAPAG